MSDDSRAIGTPPHIQDKLTKGNGLHKNKMADGIRLINMTTYDSPGNIQQGNIIQCQCLADHEIYLGAIFL